MRRILQTEFASGAAALMRRILQTEFASSAAALMRRILRSRGGCLNPDMQR